MILLFDIDIFIENLYQYGSINVKIFILNNKSKITVKQLNLLMLNDDRVITIIIFFKLLIKLIYILIMN